MRNVNGFSRGLNWDDQDATYPNRVDASIVADMDSSEDFIEVPAFEPEGMPEIGTTKDHLYNELRLQRDRIQTLRGKAREAAKIVRAIETLRNAGLLD